MDARLAKWWHSNSEGVLQCMCQHVVAIAWTLHRDGHEPRTQVASGFLVRTKDMLFWVTAGHVLKSLEEAVKSGARIAQAQLWDGWHLSNRGPSIPFRDALRDASMIWLDSEEWGVDCGAIAIPIHYARLLGAVGQFPIVRRAFARKHDQFDLYVMLGFSDDGTKISTHRGKGEIAVHMRAGTPLVPLEVAPPPEERRPTRLPQHFFRLLGTEPLDIHGMSGGPIFGVHMKEDGCSYRLVGLQSAIWPPSGELIACPIDPFMTIVAKRFADLLRAPPLIETR